MRTAIAYLLTCVCCAAALPETNRVISWARVNIGVEGGIPSGQPIYTNLWPSGGNDFSAIDTALRNCPSGSAVKLWLGDFTLGQMLDFKNYRSNIKLLGVGARTGLIFTDAFPACIYLRSTDFDEDKLVTSTNLAQTAIKGTNILTVFAVPSWLVVGGKYIVDSIADTNLVYGYGTSENENPAAGYREQIIFNNTASRQARSLGQVVRVQAIIGTNITIELPVNYSFRTEDVAQIALAGINPATTQTRTNVGFENFRIEGRFSGNDTDMFRVEDAENCWWRGVTFTNNPGRRFIQTVFCRRLEIRDSILRGAQLVSSGKGYGIALYHDTTACLIENCVFLGLHSPISNDFGSDGNAWAYNTVLQGRSDSGQNPAMGTHGTHCYMLNYEGNFCVDKVLFDYSHGSASHLTLLRNRIRGYDGVHTADQIPVVIEFYNRSNSIVGNLLGTVGFHTNLIATATNVFCNDSTRDIFHLGYFSYGCAYGSNNFDSVGVNAAFLAVNWDAVTATNHGIVLGGFTTNDVPTSLIYGSVPSWWPAGKHWPPFDPNMGDAPMTNLLSGMMWQSVTSVPPAMVVKVTATTLKLGF